MTHALVWSDSVSSKKPADDILPPSVPVIKLTVHIQSAFLGGIKPSKNNSSGA